MLGFQILTLSFCIFMLYVVRIHHAKRNLPSTEALFWYIVWTSLIFIILLPQTLAHLINIFSINRVFDLLVILAFMVLITITLQHRIQIYKLQTKLEQLVRNLSHGQQKK